MKYIFSRDHKIIGIQYGLGAVFFLFTGFILVLLMRWQLAFPGKPLPFFNFLMTPEQYNQLGAMHGTIMVFLGVVPMVVGAFGNYLIPLMIGAKDMAFPTMNALSFWTFFLGGAVMMFSFFVPGGAPQAGWTAYPPLASLQLEGQTVWLVGMLFIITSSLLGSINSIVTILHLRTAQMRLPQMPLFVWTQLVTAFLLLLAFPPLETASLLQLMDRVFHTSFFMPSGLIISGEKTPFLGGGSPILWQHLFWFLAHPEVYVLILPAVGIVAQILETFSKKDNPYHSLMVKSMVALGFLSFLVWAHHMFLTGMGTKLNNFFQVTTLLISIPSVVLIVSLVLSLWGGALEYKVPMLFALAFLPMFGLGGLTGLPLGFAVADLYLHDSYYVIGHFHYIVAPGTLFAIFAGIYYWFPKMTGTLLSEKLGKIHFWGSLVCMNGIFFPMFFVGMAGVSRRLYDMSLYAHAKKVFPLNVVMSISAAGLALFQLVFVLNIIWSLRKKRAVPSNPWAAKTLEWILP